jgi:hypothetical protein
MTVWLYVPPSRWRRYLSNLRDLPYVFVDHIGDDEEKAFTRRLMLAILLTFVAAVALWLIAWWLK